jgi:hypothetical protein
MRPEQSKETLSKWVTRAKQDIEVIISLDEDDSTIAQYETNNKETGATILVNKNRSAVDAINHAAKASTRGVILVVSDDTDCPDGWAESIIQAVQGRTDWILKTQDGIQKWLITMPVMDRVYYNRTGYVYYPEYKHMFCDTELTCVADMTCRKIESPLLFPHLHYSRGLSKKDALNERNDNTWTQGETLFLERYKQNFGITNPECAVQDKDYLAWIKKKIRK